MTNYQIIQNNSIMEKYSLEPYNKDEEIADFRKEEAYLLTLMPAITDST